MIEDGGGFECSAALHGKKEYFRQLSRYWMLHQSKCDVLSVLLQIPTKNFDAESERPMTPYLENLMMMHSTKTSKLPKSSLSFTEKTQDLLLVKFLQGVNQYLMSTPKKRVKYLIPSSEISYTDGNSSPNGYSNMFGYYWIRVSILPILYYLWVYGDAGNSSRFSHESWTQLIKSGCKGREDLIKEFKSRLAVLPLHLKFKSCSFAGKHRRYFYAFEYHVANNDKEEKRRDAAVEIDDANEKQEVADNDSHPSSSSSSLVNLHSLFKAELVFSITSSAKSPSQQQESRKQPTKVLSLLTLKRSH